MSELKQHPIYTDYYGTKNGEVYSKKYKKERIKKIKPMKLNTGYYLLGLTHNKKRYQVTHHKFIADIFVLNPNNYSEINHKDENKNNNCADNLEWCSRKQNMKHSAHKFSKFFLVENLKTNEIFEIQNLSEWCKVNNVSRGLVYHILHGKSKQTKGFRFYYSEKNL